MTKRNDAHNLSPLRPNRDSPQWHGLVAWWPLQDRGISVRDFGPSKRFVGAENLTSVTADPEMGIIRVIDGASPTGLERVRVDRPAIESYPFSLSAWVNFNSFTNVQGIMNIADANVDDKEFGIIFHTISGGTIWALVQNGAAIEHAEVAAPAAGEWTLIVGVFPSASSRSVWVNLNKVVNTNSISLPTDLSRTVLGAVDNFTEEFPLDGRMADARVYNRVLSDSEIGHMYNPATRWDLYTPSRRSRLQPEAVVEDISHVAALADSFDNVVQRRTIKVTNF